MGATLEGALNDFISIEGSFSYAKDNYSYNTVSSGYGSTCSTCSGYQGGGYGQQSYGNYYSPQAITLSAGKRNTLEFGTGIKLGVRIQKIRPFAAAGIAANLNRYTIDDPQTLAYANDAGWSRSSLNVLGNFGGGMDVNFSKNIGLGARFDYQAVLNKSDSAFKAIWSENSPRYRLLGNLIVSF